MDPIQEIKQLVSELRQKYEESQKGLISASDFKAAQEKIEARLDALETKMNRPPIGDSGTKDERTEKSTAERKAFGTWLRKGILGPEERKVLTISDDTTGGFLSGPPDYVREIIKGITEISPIRQLARVRETVNRTIQVPKRTGQFSAARTAEVAERTERTGLKYGLEEMALPEAYALVRVSRQDLEDSAFNLEAEIAAEIVEQFAVLEGTEFLTGNGVGQAEGILINTTVIAGCETTAGSNAIAADDLIGVQYALKEGYARNASWLMKRATVKVVRLLKEATTNAYIWQPGLQANQPATLLGNPVVECVDMPSGLVDNQYEVAYGDFRRGYLIGDRIQIEIQRLVEKYAEFGQIGFMARKRFNGQVVLPEAIKLLKIKA